MLRSSLRPHLRTGGAAPWSRLMRPSPRPSRPSKPSRPSLTFTRNNHQNGSQWEQHWAYPPVPVLSPLTWSIGAISTIYITCAAYDVYQDVKRYPKERQRSIDVDQLEADVARRRPARGYHSQPAWTDRLIAAWTDGPIAAWNSLNGPHKVLAGVTATNAAMLLLANAPAGSSLQRFILGLSHVPVEGCFRNSQLLTCAFLHTGPLHLFMNFLVLFNFAPQLARSPEFSNSGSHLLAFFLSGAIVSSLGAHFSCLFWPNKLHRFRMGMGFSGVVSAVFAAWCIENPNTQVRFFPFTSDFTSMGVLQTSAGFEALGVLGLWSLLRLPLNVSFAAHLTGLAFGAAYVTYGGKRKAWKLARRVAFRALKTTHVI